MKPVRGVLNAHDRDRFAVTLFADNCDEEGIAWFHQGPQDAIHLTGTLDNETLAELIRHESLDILIDLNGYSVTARLGLWTERLARVTTAWFNMYATSALPGLDWIIGDDRVIRPDEEHFYTERVARLPQSYLTFAVDHAAPDIVPPPYLVNGFVTFGSLVSQYKITPEVLDDWCTMLRRAPASRLVLANSALGPECNRNFLMAAFSNRGIAAERITILPPASHFEFLGHYGRIDLALDAFPYNGGTTTTEAIWQGVPVLCFDGDRWASRTSSSLLSSCHLAEFIAANRQAWIDMAVRLATSETTGRVLANLRPTMRERLLASDVCQTGRMARAMEQLFVKMLSERAGHDPPPAAVPHPESR
jgi:predicted O-linked N-acetylglucosamine transferase (SPINDLY family)